MILRIDAMNIIYLLLPEAAIAGDKCGLVC